MRSCAHVTRLVSCQLSAVVTGIIDDAVDELLQAESHESVDCPSSSKGARQPLDRGRLGAFHLAKIPNMIQIKLPPFTCSSTGVQDRALEWQPLLLSRLPAASECDRHQKYGMALASASANTISSKLACR